MNKNNLTIMNEEKRVRCEVYSRVVGYLRPVSQWNDGKMEEWKERKTYDKHLNEDSSLNKK